MGRRSEHAEQVAFHDEMERAGIYGTAHPAGGHSTRFLGAARKAAGARPGWPDYQVTTPVPRRPQARSLFLEFKSPDLKHLKAGEPDEDQKRCHAQLRRDGCLVYVVYSCEEALGVLRSLGYRV